MTNHFTLFNLPEAFALDEAALEKTYFALQREHHPDKAAGKDALSKAQAMQAATRINDAYHCLKSPLKRAIYLLKLQGLDPARADEALLMQAMEDREALMEAQTMEGVLRLEVKAKEENRFILSKLENIFNVKDYNGAAALITRLQYNEKFASEVRLKKLKGF